VAALAIVGLLVAGGTAAALRVARTRLVSRSSAGR
jgi:hypothetical protein